MASGAISAGKFATSYAACYDAAACDLATCDPAAYDAGAYDPFWLATAAPAFYKALLLGPVFNKLVALASFFICLSKIAY